MGHYVGAPTECKKCKLTSVKSTYRQIKLKQIENSLQDFLVFMKKPVFWPSFFNNIIKKAIVSKWKSKNTQDRLFLRSF